MCFQPGAEVRVAAKQTLKVCDHLRAKTDLAGDATRLRVRRSCWKASACRCSWSLPKPTTSRPEIVHKASGLTTSLEFTSCLPAADTMSASSAVPTIRSAGTACARCAAANAVAHGRVVHDHRGQTGFVVANLGGVLKVHFSTDRVAPREWARPPSTTSRSGTRPEITSASLGRRPTSLRLRP